MSVSPEYYCLAERDGSNEIHCKHGSSGASFAFFKSILCNAKCPDIFVVSALSAHACLEFLAMCIKDIKITGNITVHRPVYYANQTIGERRLHFKE